MEQPNRILCVFGGLDRGGSETMCMNIYRNIDRTKLQFDFVKHVSKKCHYEDEILALGGRIFTAPTYKIYNHISYKKWWKNYFKEHPEHNIVHGHYFTISAIYLGIAKKFGRTTIAHSHATAATFSIKAVIKNVLQCRIRYIADYFMGCSQVAGEWLFGKKIASSEKYFNLRNAIDAESYIYDENAASDARRQLGYTPEDRVIGHVGRFTEQKNHMFLMDVFKELYRQDSRYKLLLIGEGPLTKDVREKIAEYHLESAVCVAGVRTDVNRLMMGMDLFLFPSKWEGLGIVLIEAQATACPCVTSTAVPQEAKISELVEFIDLNAPIDYWVERIRSTSIDRDNRTNMYATVVDAGYDIHDSAKWVEEFYLSIAEKSK